MKTIPKDPETTPYFLQGIVVLLLLAALGCAVWGLWWLSRYYLFIMIGIGMVSAVWLLGYIADRYTREPVTCDCGNTYRFFWTEMWHNRKCLTNNVRRT